MKHGDFSSLANDYAQYRPDYAPAVLHAVLAQASRPVHELDMVDVGAGTGIWTRMLAQSRPRTLRAVEPSDEMRARGEKYCAGWPVSWMKGSGEQTGIESGSADLLSMASSFHWVDFQKGVAEFTRVLRPGGVFVALWNPRYIEANPMLVDIEEHLRALRPELKRVSSGRSGITETLTARLEESKAFARVTYVESKHVIEMSHERYLGAWRSVNDLRVQLGEGFEGFLSFVEKKIAAEPVIRATYLTRAWVAAKA